MFYQTLRTEKPDRNGNARAINIYYSDKGEAVGLSLVYSSGPEAAAKDFSEAVRFSAGLKHQQTAIQYAYPLGLHTIEPLHITPRQYRRLCFMLAGDWMAVFPAYADCKPNPRRGPNAPKITRARIN